MQLKEIHTFLIDLVRILKEKNDYQEKEMKRLHKEKKLDYVEAVEYTKGQLYEANYILEIVEKIIYENKSYVG